MASFDIGAFLKSIGQSGVTGSTQLGKTRKAKAAAKAREPFDRANLEQLQIANRAKSFDIDTKKLEAQKKEEKQRKLDMVQKLLTDPEVIEHIQKNVTSPLNLGGAQAQPGLPQPIRTEETVPIGKRPPTEEEQLGRLRGAGMEFSGVPEIQKGIEGLAGRVEGVGEREKFGLEEEKFGLAEDKLQTGVEEKEKDRQLKRELAAAMAIEKNQLANMKKEEKDKKRKDQQQDINSGIEAVLALSEGVKPHGRVLGVIDKVGKWSGFNPNLSSLDNTAGLLAGQVAKKIGGESGRLTDQDRIYALRVMPKSTDTQKERKMKIAILKVFQNPDVVGEEIRKKLIETMVKLNTINSKKYEIVDEAGTVVDTSAEPGLTPEEEEELLQLEKEFGGL